MKTRLLFSLATALMLFTNTITANNVENLYDLGGTRLTISALANEKAVVVNATNTFDQNLTIQIEDIKGNVLLTDRVKEGQNFAKKYKMTQLENGEYRLVVIKKMFKTVQPFELTNEAVTMAAVQGKEKFLPSVLAKDGKMDVNVLLGNYSNIHIRIYDNEGKKVFEDTNYVVFNLHKRFDISKLGNGVYFAEVTAGDETQVFPLEL